MSKMKHTKITLIMLLLLSSITFIIAAIDIPRIEPYVNDFAGLLNAQEELQLNLLADQIEQNTTFEIAIVTVIGTGGQDRLEFAGKIGDLNGVGKKDADNGLVVLWSLSDDAGGAIATGRGSESFVTDGVTGTIGRAARSQYFNKEDYAGGFNYILNELDKVIISHQDGSINNTGTQTTDDEQTSEMVWFAIMIIIFILFRIVIFPIVDFDDDSSGGSSGGWGGGGFGGGGSKW
jgi:uncharacterized protein